MKRRESNIARGTALSLWILAGSVSVSLAGTGDARADATRLLPAAFPSTDDLRFDFELRPTRRQLRDSGPGKSYPEIPDAVRRQVIDDRDGAIGTQASLNGTIDIDTFDAGSAVGTTRSSTTWVGQVAQNAQSITVGGTARDDNGWGVTGLSLDAGGMRSLNISAQRHAGNAAPSLFIQFEDRALNTQVFSISTSVFSMTDFTTAQIPIDSWAAGFNPTDIVGWSIGGGGVGTLEFNMSLERLEFSPVAIPEASTVAAILGLVALIRGMNWRRGMRRILRSRR